MDTLGPMIGDEEEVLRIRAAEDSRPSILVKWWDDDLQPQGIVINRQKEDEEVCLLKKALNQATCIVNVSSLTPDLSHHVCRLARALIKLLCRGFILETRRKPQPLRN
jgi:hypothetical protein